jgi:hypothetical protein
MPKLGEKTATHSHQGFQIQSVLVPKDKFTRSEAIKYIREHFAYKKIDSTQRKNFYSFRQIEPTQNSKYFTKVLADGVELVCHCIGIADGSVEQTPITDLYGVRGKGVRPLPKIPCQIF